MPWIITAAVALILVIWYVSSYNGLISLRNTCEEAFSTMDVYLKKRYDMIPNLVEIVKGYAKHESQTLEKVIAARSNAMSAAGEENKFEAENALSGTLKSLFAIAESYPDLKANQNYSQLMSELSAVEEDISNSRKYYNGTVRSFNTKVESIPSNIVASIGGFKRKPLFEIDEASRENVKISM